MEKFNYNFYNHDLSGKLFTIVNLLSGALLISMVSAIIILFYMVLSKVGVSSILNYLFVVSLFSSILSAVMLGVLGKKENPFSKTIAKGFFYTLKTGIAHFLLLIAVLVSLYAYYAFTDPFYHGDWIFSISLKYL